ncbi:MAG: LysM domain-containing protein, partial [Miltoncostaeaceae bacterium]
MTPRLAPTTRRPRALRCAAMALIAMVLLALAATAATAATVQVRPGDTLSGIAARAGVGIQSLAAANGIADPDRIVAGTVLTLPGRGAPSAGGGSPGGPSAGHTVRPGESLSAIAARYGVGVHSLASANGIADPDRIVAGAVLVIPGGSPCARARATAPSAAPPSAAG